MPTPAAPKPQCHEWAGLNPQWVSSALNWLCWARKPVTSGATKAPTLMPM